MTYQDGYRDGRFDRIIGNKASWPKVEDLKEYRRGYLAGWKAAG